jgi:GT2 family glycosyltransferase
VSPDSTQNQDIVTAVIVAHDGAAWLPRVVQAIANQTRPVQRVVAVDTGSTDRSGAMLAQAFGRAAVFGMERATGYGVAVAKALRHRAANTHQPPPAGGLRDERAEWVWLLHDDCEPALDSLQRLLAGALQAPAAAVLGPKVRDWSDRDVLLETGLTIDRAGRRVTGIEPREADQGQHDGDRDVLAVSSAGMLVRRDVWDDVGGFDPGMRLFREDTDFCWRVQAAGHRVRVITDAVVYHVEASARNRRQASAAPRPWRQDRRNALLVLAGNLPARPMLSSLAGNLVLSALRTMFFLLAKRPGAALDETAAYASVAGHPLRLSAARRRRSPGRQAAYSRLGRDIPPGRSFRKLAEYASGTLSRSLPAEAVGSHHATDDPSDDDWLLTDTGLVQRLLTNPGVLLFLALTVIALVAERSLLGSTPLGGGALVPAWGGASGLWREYLQGFHPAGIGTAASTPPYVAVVALVATVLGGKPWLAVDVILLGCVPLAGISAYLATRRVTRYVPARVAGSFAYALLPVGIGAVATGRLGTAVLLVLLPPIGVLAGVVFAGPRRRARRAAWAMALLVAVAAAFVPLFWLITAVAMAVGVLALGRRRASVLNGAIVAAVPLVLLLPWILDVAAHPARMFLEAGVVQPGLATRGLTARSLLLLSPGGPGLPPFWVTAGLAAAAAVALVLAAGRRSLVLAGWVVAVTGLVTAAVVSRLAISQAGPAAPVPAWPGPALAVAGAGLLLAVVAASDRIPGRLRTAGWRSGSGLAVLALCALACSAPVLAAGYWLSSGVTGPVRLATAPLLPEFVSVSSDTGLRLRTLVLRPVPGGSVTYTVLRDADPLIGSQELALPAAAQRALNLAAATLSTPAGSAAGDQGAALARFGIGYVLLPAPVDAGLARRLDGVAGLRPVSVTSAFDLWRVVDTAAQVTVAEPGGTVVAVPSSTLGVDGARAPAAGGTLVLAEPAGGWSASLNGHPLTPLASPVDGWAQGFRLPPGGGTLSLGRSNLGRDAAVVLEVLAVLLVAALGLPGAKVAGEAAREAVPARDSGERPAGEELAEGGRRAGRSRRRRSAHRGRATPEIAPEAEVPRPAAPVPATARPRAAVPAGVRVGWPRRAAGPAEAEPPFADEPLYVPGRRRRPGGDPVPPGSWGEEDPRDREPAGYGPPRGRGDYPDPLRAPGSPTGPQPRFSGGVPGGEGDYPDARRGVGRRAAPGRADGGDGPGGRDDHPHLRRAFGRRAGLGRRAADAVPEGEGDYPDPRRGLGRRAAPGRGTRGSGPGPGDYPGTRQDSGRPAGPERVSGAGAPYGRGDYALPAPGGSPGRTGRESLPAPGGSPGRTGRESLPARGGADPPARGRPPGLGQLPLGGGRRGRPGPPREPAPRRRPPGDDAALSPLPPLPPRSPRRSRWEDVDVHSDGAPPGPGRHPRERGDQAGRDDWDRAPRDDWDQAPAQDWDRARRDEWDEPDR